MHSFHSSSVDTRQDGAAKQEVHNLHAVEMRKGNSDSTVSNLVPSRTFNSVG